MRRIVGLALLILLNVGVCFAQTHTAPALDVPSTFTANQGFPHNSLGFVNVITNCGLVGDGVTNDGAALVTCFAANPGKRIFFPKTQAVGSCDYRVNGNILLPSGHGQIWEGEGAGWAGQGTRICKTVEDGNPLVDIVHANCQNCTIKNLHFTGPSAWSSVTLTQNIPPCSPPSGQNYPAGTVCVNAGDGILVEGGFTTLENVYVENFGRNGIWITSNFGGFPDNFHLVNVTSNNNRGSGLYIKGGDANAGSSLQFHAYNNLMYCLDDQGFLGNAHYSPQVTGCHPTGSTTGATFSITAASRAANVVTLTAAGHNVSAGNVIVVAGVSDGTFNNTFSVTSVTSTTITYAQTAANASSSGGTVRLTSNNEFYTFTGIVGGSYNYGTQAAAWNTLFAPYCEGSQNPITGQTKLLILGGDQGCGIDYTFNPLVIGNAIISSPIQAANFATGTGGFSFLTPVDNGGLLFNFAAGKTIDTSIEHRFMGAHSLTTYWDWVHTVGASEAGNTAGLTLFRGSNGSHKRLAFGGPGVAGVTEILDEGTATRINNGTGTSGNVEFYSAGGGQLIFDFLSNGQYALTPSTNNIDVFSIKRFTDSSPTGNFQVFKNAASTPLWNVDITGKLTVGTMDVARITTGTFAKSFVPASAMYTDQANTITAGKLTTLASATGGAGFNIPAGVAPSSPVIGDQWMVGANLFYRDNSGSPATQTVEIQSNKNVASGYAGLNGSSTINAAQMPALTGDVTSSAGSVSTTVGKVNGGTVAGTNGNFASYGASNQFADSGIATTAVPQFKGTSVNSVGLQASSGTLNLLASAPAGTYRISFYASISQAATTSSNLALQFFYNDGNTSVTYQPVSWSSNILGPAGANNIFAPIVFKSAASQNIAYAATYTSVGATPMKYDLYIVLEKLQ